MLYITVNIELGEGNSRSAPVLAPPLSLSFVLIYVHIFIYTYSIDVLRFPERSSLTCGLALSPQK